MSYFIGVDVGSGSARAGVFNESGVMLATSSYKINIYKPEENFVEQSSENIWQSVCASVKDAISIANIDINKISGIGFDAVKVGLFHGCLCRYNGFGTLGRT